MIPSHLPRILATLCAFSVSVTIPLGSACAQERSYAHIPVPADVEKVLLEKLRRVKDLEHLKDLKRALEDVFEHEGKLPIDMKGLQQLDGMPKPPSFSEEQLRLGKELVDLYKD